jgi:N-acetylglucosamine-6-phosphate deacetylase
MTGEKSLQKKRREAAAKSKSIVDSIDGTARSTGIYLEGVYINIVLRGTGTTYMCVLHTHIQYSHTYIQQKLYCVPVLI